MSLAWGRHYVMVEPTHFRIDYAINPFMDPADHPDRELALLQWRTLVATIERLGGTVDGIPQRPDAPDMVYAMTLGLALTRGPGEQPGARRGRGPRRGGPRAARRALAHALPAAPDGDGLGPAVVRRP